MLTPEQIEQTRKWRKRFELAETPEQRQAVREAASADLGITVKSVTDRWHRLGMCREWNFMKPVVREAVERYPFASDRQLSLWFNVNFSSFSATRIRLRIPSCLVRRRAALRAEVAVYVRDYPDLSPEQVRDSIKADGELPWRFSRKTVAQLMKELRDERAAS